MIECDHICGVRMFLPSPPPPRKPAAMLILLGIYMPSTENTQEIYSSYLESVEHCISQFESDGPVLIVGDLNAHLGSRNDLNTNHTNHRGMQWNAVISEHNLSNVSLGSLSSGATYTYILLW